MGGNAYLKIQKKAYCFLGGVILVLVCILLFVWACSFHLKIGKHTISEQEFLDCMEAVMYDTKAQIQQAYGAEYTEDFWTAEYGDIHGYDVLVDHTIEELKYIHAVYDLAKENGDVADGSYKALAKRWKAENKERSEKLKKGEVVYGLKEYTFEIYLQYEMSTLKETYCNSLDHEGMTLTEEEVLAHYQSRDWIFGDSEENADLETARVAVERELREKKYDEMVTQRIEAFEVDGDLERVAKLVLKKL